MPFPLIGLMSLLTGGVIAKGAYDDAKEDEQARLKKNLLGEYVTDYTREIMSPNPFYGRPKPEMMENDPRIWEKRSKIVDAATAIDPALGYEWAQKMMATPKRNVMVADGEIYEVPETGNAISLTNKQKPFKTNTWFNTETGAMKEVEEGSDDEKKIFNSGKWTRTKGEKQPQSDPEKILAGVKYWTELRDKSTKDSVTWNVAQHNLDELQGKKPDKERDTFGDEAKLRGEFKTITDRFGLVRDSFANIRGLYDNPSAAGDISLIYSYMKMLDPNSTVRESEYATAENAAGVPDKVRAQWNRLKKGEFLTPEMRLDFVTQASKLYQTSLNAYRNDEERYNFLADEYGVPRSRVTYDRSGKLQPLTEDEKKRAEELYRIFGLKK
jgi:hypothetical protein